MMPTTAKILLLIVTPLIWGLAVEYVFELLRRRKGYKIPPNLEDTQATEHDWVI